MTFAETKEEYLDIQKWIAGYTDAVLTLDLETREGIMAAAEMLREMHKNFYDRFVLPLTEIPK